MQPPGMKNGHTSALWGVMAVWRLHKTAGVVVFFWQLTPVVTHGLSQRPSSMEVLGGFVIDG